jgi:DNA-nicking Smr family endonuclease
MEMDDPFTKHIRYGRGGYHPPALKRKQDRRLHAMQKPAGAAPSTVTLDLHGKTQYQARVTIDAALRRSRGVYRIHVVHGYHNGTALREMIRQEYAAHPLVLRIDPVSESATDLVLREL